LKYLENTKTFSPFRNWGGKLGKKKIKKKGGPWKPKSKEGEQRGRKLHAGPKRESPWSERKKKKKRGGMFF